jgi:hypothetical protein
MIPLELLRVRIGRGWIKPRFLKLDLSNIKMAEDVILAFSLSLGKKKMYLLERLEELEEVYDHRVIRGLAVLLERRCIFERKGGYDPIRLRREVFMKAERRGGVYTEEERRGVLEEVAKGLGLTVDELEEEMWSDLEEELYLRDFQGIKPDKLLRLYNLSLIQSLLLRSTNLEVSIKGGWKELLRRAKYLGLMYHAELGEEGVSVTFDGPSSIVRLTERYGSSLAKLIPLIIRRKGWKLRAFILRKTESGKRFLKFELGEKEVEGLVSSKVHEEVTFDSSLEKAFFSDFHSLGTDWRLYREEEPIIAGNTIYLPDFRFEKDGVRVYMEVMGFWTPEYVKKKVEKLKKVKEVKLIVAIQEDLACSETEELKHEVIYFRKRVPVADVLRVLRKVEAENVTKQVEELKKIGVKVEGDVVKLKELAKGYSVEAISRFVKEVGLKGYVALGEQLVSEGKLREIDGKLSKVSSLYDAIDLIKGEGIEDYSSVLRTLGYEIMWKGLDGRSALIKKRVNASSSPSP